MSRCALDAVPDRDPYLVADGAHSVWSKFIPTESGEATIRPTSLSSFYPPHVTVFAADVMDGSGLEKMTFSC